MKFNIVTIFPEILDSYINESILKRAQEKDLIEINMINLRDFTKDKHKTTDDIPYGGGHGMVMKIEPLYKAIQHIKKTASKNYRILLMSPKGETFTQRTAEDFSKLDEIIFICGRYEGVDERIHKFIDAEISIGDFVLCGGELPAITITEAVARLLPEVLGHQESAKQETFAENLETKDHPHYTRPEHFEYTDEKGNKKTLSVPKVLLSGNHGKIGEWRSVSS